MAGAVGPWSTEETAEDFAPYLEQLAEHANGLVQQGEVQAAIDLLRDAYMHAGGLDGADPEPKDDSQESPRLTHAKEKGARWDESGQVFHAPAHLFTARPVLELPPEFAAHAAAMVAAQNEKAPHEIESDRKLAEVKARAEAPACPGGLVAVPQTRATLCLVLCAVLSRAGRHEEALGAARAAAAEMEGGWKEEVVTRPGEAAERLAALVSRTPAWFTRAVEVTIQAKHCIALELEFISGMDATAALPPGLRRDVEHMHLEAFILARHLLPRGHASRDRAERLYCQWGSRIANPGEDSEAMSTQFEPSDERVRASEVLAMLAGPPPPPALETARSVRSVRPESRSDTKDGDAMVREGSQSSKRMSSKRRGASKGPTLPLEPEFGEMLALPGEPTTPESPNTRLRKHERMYQGIRPHISPTTMRELKQRRLQCLSGDVPAFSPLSSPKAKSPSRPGSQMFDGFDSPPSPSSPMSRSWAELPRGSQSLELPQGSSPMSRGMGQASPMSTGGWSGFSGKSTRSWGHFTALPGELYSRSATPMSELPNTPSWKVTRRVPGNVTMMGAGGKATWALRSTGRGPKAALNAFDDWLETFGGDLDDLEHQVAATCPEFFQKGYRSKSHNFKHFTLKEIPPDGLYENAVYYCESSIRVHKKQGRIPQGPGLAEMLDSPLLRQQREKAKTALKSSKGSPHRGGDRSSTGLAALRQRLAMSHKSMQGDVSPGSGQPSRAGSPKSRTR